MKNNIKSDSFLKDLGLDTLTNKEMVVTYFKILIIMPLTLSWKLLKFLFNPSKKILMIVKKVIVFPLLEFVTGKKTSDKLLEDYTNIHQAIIRNNTFKEHIKLNFEAHKDILINSKISTFILMICLIVLYGFAFEAVRLFEGLITAGTFYTIFIADWRASALAILAYFPLVADIVLTIALFAVEFSLLKSLFVTTREEIKDYIDETIFYADVKNEEIFGKEHALAVRNAIYEAYLIKKESVGIINEDDIKGLLAHHDSSHKQINHLEKKEDKVNPKDCEFIEEEK